MNSYKGITFAKDYNKSFAEFKEEFGSTHVFKKMHPTVRAKELNKAYKIATNGITSKTKGKSKENSAEETE